MIAATYFGTVFPLFTSSTFFAPPQRRTVKKSSGPAYRKKTRPANKNAYPRNTHPALLGLPTHGPGLPHIRWTTNRTFRFSIVCAIVLSGADFS